MKFTPIDRTTWERRSHYEYYTNLLKCGYSVTVSLDITAAPPGKGKRISRILSGVCVLCVEADRGNEGISNGTGQRRESGIL